MMYRITTGAIKALFKGNPSNTLKRQFGSTSLLNLRQSYKVYLGVFSGASVAGFVAYRYDSLSVQCEDANEILVEESSVLQENGGNTDNTQKAPIKWKLYQYATCPFCCKTRAFLDYYNIDYEKVEVNPVTRKEIKFSDYRKVPFIKSEEHQINDSSLIISLLKSHFLGKGDLNTLLTYYPYLEDESQKGKGKGQYQNLYNIMYQQGFSHAQNKAIREEAKWRRWVDECFVHTLSPNIYRTMTESLQAMEYITSVGNFTDREQTIIYYTGALAMYVIGKRVKTKHHLKKDVRQSLYEEANRWLHNVGKKHYMGGKQPNLADLNMYGVISAIEGLDAFNDLMMNTNIGPWYKRMKKQVSSHRGSIDPDWLSLVK